MLDQFISKLIDNKGKVTFGTVILLLFGLIGWQVRDSATARKELLDLFKSHSEQTKQTNTNQWQNQAAIATGLNALAIAVNRIEAVLRIPPEMRAEKAPSIEAPKTVQLKPPPKDD